MIDDIRYALRNLLKTPGFLAVAILTLALGIGANTAIFSVVNAVLLRPLPFASAARLMDVASVSRRGGMAMSYPDFQDFRRGNHSFQHLAVYHDGSLTLTVPHQSAVILNVAVVSADLFPLLGVKPLLGRAFRQEEDEDKSGPMSVVISARCWRQKFAAAPKILGKSVTLSGQLYTVIGVMPESFNFPVRNEVFDAWTTFGFSSDLRSTDGSEPIGMNRGAHYLDAVGELKPGVSAATAQADLTVIAQALAWQHEKTNKYRTIRVQPLLDEMVAQLRPALLLLLAAVGCVLLVACANVANLLLARASKRHRELAIRAALGAGRLRVIRQVLTESLLLAFLGGVAGLLLGVWGSELLTRFSPQDVPRLDQSRFDGPVFLFALGLSLLTGLAFGILPALRASQADPAESLKEGSRGTTEGIRGNRTRSLLIVGEIAMALMLLACAGLLIRSLDRLSHVNPGFEAQNVLTAQVSFSAPQYNEAQALQAFHVLKDRLRALRGVVAVGDVNNLPLAGSDWSTSFMMEGHPLPDPERPSTRSNFAGPGYLRAMGIPLLAGRDFRETDTRQAPRVVLVNQAFARKFYPGENPVGKRIAPGYSATGEAKDQMREIVGVVGSVDQDRIGKEAVPEVFMPHEQGPSDTETLVIRTTTPARNALSALESTLHSIDPDVALEDVHTMEERVSSSLAQPRFQSFLLLIFAGVALILTAVGLYGVIAYSVSQRTREIGTRMALGAQQEGILKLIVGQGMLLTALGVGIGLLGAVAVSRLLRSLLFEVTPGDPWTLGAVATIVFVVALIASFIPAWRAARVDPIAALRYE